ncbi:hypothetical protein SCLCIDRAFT_12928 [Scleroderma citrinum Foug A]|uniref:Uncharacterized protein n=1 Tax=Scleroderma citrinum Foug A TaxID=1036808 RepID=A0A0C3AWQ4_9AGAM|nr:hypothetical protein SCLCIDRAFT_12928 [Scleroderma citrinum Foug A]
MAHWKTPHSAPPTPHKHSDKPLPAPPPSPTASFSHSASSRALRSRSSSMRISRLPSFTSTLSSDQTQPQDIFAPPLPVSVVVHNESHQDLVLRRDNPYPDGYPLAKKDIYPHHDQDVRLLQPQDDKESAFPSPTLSNFSCTYSRDTCITTPCGSFPTSPASATFTPPCLAENLVLPSSPEADRTFLSETASVSVEGDGISCPLSPSHTALPSSRSVSVSRASPASSFPSSRLRTALAGVHSESRWSIATTASLTPSAAEPVKSGSLLSPRTPSRGKKPQSRNKDVKTPKQRRFINLFSRFSPGRNDASTATTASVGSVGDNGAVDESNGNDTLEMAKPSKNLNKKSSLASLRMSFSISRPSFSGTRPALSSPTEEIPPLPMSPTRPSMGAGEPPSSAVIEPMSTVAKSSIPRVPSRANLLEAALPPIPGSASTMMTFRNPSQVSLAYSSSPAASSSKVSLLPSPTASAFPSNRSTMIQHNNGSASRVSLLPPVSKRVSFQSNVGVTFGLGIEQPESVHPLDPSASPGRTKSIFRLTSKPKAPKSWASGVSVPVHAAQTKRSALGSQLPSSISADSDIGTMDFTPPAKLASVLAGEMPTPPRQPNASKIGVPQMLASPPPKSKLPIAPSRTAPLKSRCPSTPSMGMRDQDLRKMLPTPSLQRTTKLSTVRGLWRS